MISLFFSQLAAGASREIVVDPAGPLPPIDGGLRDGEFALTFDDGPDPLGTPLILSVLRKHGVQATFFQVGIHAQAMPKLTRAVVNQGHSLGSHSWDHPDLSVMPTAEALTNVRRGHAAVEQAVGSAFHSALFRFPFFQWNQDLLAAVRGVGLLPFHANVVTEDWLTPDSDELLQKSLAMVEGARHGIILFHENQQQSARMLDKFLEGFKALGFTTAVFRTAGSTVGYDARSPVLPQELATGRF